MVEMKYYLNAHTVQEQLAVLAVTNFQKAPSLPTEVTFFSAT